MFDGKKRALEIEVELKTRVSALKKAPKLVIIWIGDENASRVYVEKKKKVGERIGINVEVIKQEKLDVNVAGQYDGLMVQLPVPGMGKEDLLEELKKIPLEKDVDGLNPENHIFLPATVRAVERVMMDAGVAKRQLIGVVGSRGAVGRPLLAHLGTLGYKAIGLDVGDDLIALKDCDVVISATGRPGLITGDLIRLGITMIDVGFPEADFSVDAIKKGGFVTPVPGGVGPMTVVSLMENVVIAAERLK